MVIRYEKLHRNFKRGIKKRQTKKSVFKKYIRVFFILHSQLLKSQERVV